MRLRLLALALMALCVASCADEPGTGSANGSALPAPAAPVAGSVDHSNAEAVFLAWLAASDRGDQDAIRACMRPSQRSTFFAERSDFGVRTVVVTSRQDVSATEKWLTGKCQEYGATEVGVMVLDNGAWYVDSSRSLDAKFKGLKPGAPAKSRNQPPRPASKG